MRIKFWGETFEVERMDGVEASMTAEQMEAFAEFCNAERETEPEYFSKWIKKGENWEEWTERGLYEIHKPYNGMYTVEIYDYEREDEMKYYDVNYTQEIGAGAHDGVSAASLEEAALKVRDWNWREDKNILDATISDPEDDSRIAVIFPDGGIVYRVEVDGFYEEEVK